MQTINQTAMSRCTKVALGQWEVHINAGILLWARGFFFTELIWVFCPNPRIS